MAAADRLTPWAPGAYFTIGPDGAHWAPVTDFARALAAQTDAIINRAAQSSRLALYQQRKQARINAAFKRSGL
jgi:hypothetical protein